MRKIIAASWIICLWVMFSNVYADGTHPQGIRLDGSIGNAGKIDLPGPNYAIKPEYGKQAGPNLFHSFQQFNIHSGESATFSGPSSVKNIISRVTGGSASWIDGKLASTIPGADMYFLNPAGVMFGSNASLDLSGSFHVSTADYLRLGDNERFYSKPIENEVLSVAAPSAFGFLSDKPAKISVEGAKLQVAEEKNISLIGGDIEIRKGTLQAPGGQVAIGEKGNVSLSDGSLIDVSGTGSGSVFIRGGQLLAEDSIIQAYTTGAKDGGIVDIQADSISFKDGAYINSNTVGKGKGGDVILKATESVSFAGENSKAGVSRIETATTDKTEGAGDAGILTIDAKNISFAGGAYINSNTVGKGNGGEVSLKASESVSFAGENSKAGVSRIETATTDKEEGAGSAGKLTIDAKNISFADGAYINSNTEGKGKGGEVTLKASESVSFVGEDSKAGVSRIETATTDKEAGAGDAGKLTIDAKNIAFTDGAYILSGTFGKGKGGEVNLKASESVLFAGESSKAQRSWIFINTLDKEEGAGAAGKLSVEAENISFTGGSGISSNTEGKGKGGEVTLKAAESVSFSGESSMAKTSGINIDTWDREEGAGDAGKLTIEAKNISFTNGARIYSNVYGKGKGGEVTLNAEESVSFKGEMRYPSDIGIGMLIGGESGIAIGTIGDGDAKNLTIEAKNISFTKGATIYSGTGGNGNGGEVILNAKESITFAGQNIGGIPGAIGISSIGKESKAGNAGNLMINAKNIYFEDGTYINGRTSGKGRGADITIRATESVSFVEDDESKFVWGGIRIYTDDTEEGAGSAGKLTIDAKNISFADGAHINSNAYGKGAGGEVIVNAADTITLFGVSSKGNSSSVVAESKCTYENSGSGGKITISAQKVQLSDGAYISTSSAGGGQAGDISLNVGNLEMRGDATISSDATNSGGGRITVDAKDTVSLTDSSITTNVYAGIEKGGDITIGNPDTGTGSRFVILNHSRIQANAQDGDGGAVFIQTQNFLKSADSRVTATSERGNQGTVEIQAPDLDLSGALMFLPGSILDAAQFAPTPCYARSGRTFSSFVIRGFDAIPAPPDDLQSLPLSEADAMASESENTTSVSEYLNLSDYFEMEKISGDVRCETCDKK